MGKMGLGGWSFSGPMTFQGSDEGWPHVDDNEIISTIKQAFRSGVALFDTADVYGFGRSERLIGQALKNYSRESYKLWSKFGWNIKDYQDPLSLIAIRRSLESSLRNLKTDYLDCYFAHHCKFSNDEQVFEIRNLMNDFIREGKVHKYGLCSWDANELDGCIDNFSPDIIQTERNIISDKFVGSRAYDYCRANSKTPVFFSPLKHGVLTRNYLGTDQFKQGDFRRNLVFLNSNNKVAAIEVYKSNICRRFRDQENPLLFAAISYCLTLDIQSVVLIGCRNQSQIRNTTINRYRTLTDEELRFVKNEARVLKEIIE